MAGRVLLYRRFAAALTGDCARLEADVVSYSFIVSDLHRLLVAGLPAHCEKISVRYRAEPGLRGGDALTGLHVQPRLAVGDVSARQALDPSRDEESDAAPNRSDRQTTSVHLGKTHRRGVA